MRTLRPEIFINEDLSKNENRVNLSLYSLMLIPAVREIFLYSLHLPNNSVIYPPQTTKGVRPDFVVCHENNVIAWIEAEFGSENQKQLNTYKELFYERVISITGNEGCSGDVSLNKIAEKIRHIKGYSPQQEIHVQGFNELVLNLSHNNAYKEYTEPLDELRKLPIFQALINELGAAVIYFGAPPVQNGRLLVTTITQSGWSIKVMTKEAAGNSFSLSWSTGNNLVRFPSKDKLLHYFPKSIDVVNQYVEFFLGVNLDIRNLEPNQSLGIPLDLLEQHIDTCSKCLYSFASIYANG